MDRVVALSNSILTIVSAFWAIEWWEVLLLVVATYTNYFASVFYMKKKNFEGYQIAHTLWHIIGSASISYVTANACGAQTSFSPACRRQWVGGLYCNCFGSTNSSL